MIHSLVVLLDAFIGARKQEVRFLPETQILCLSTYNDRLDIVEQVVEYYKNIHLRYLLTPLVQVLF